MDDGYSTDGIVQMTEFGVGRCENDPTEICTRSLAKIELGLLDRGVVSSFQIVGEAKGKAIARSQLWIDPLGKLQRRDGRISLS